MTDLPGRGARAGDVGPVDHLVYAAPDLEEGVRRIEELLGVRTVEGGRHLGLGTRNRLVGLGPRTYLEVVGIDDGQPAPARARWFGLDERVEPGLATWCVAAVDLEAVVARGRASGVELGDPIAGGRERPDGSRLSWTFTDPWASRADGVVPFFIDWGGGPHPASDLPPGCTLVGVRLEHPRPDSVRGWLGALGLDTAVAAAHAPRVIATIRTPTGVVELS